MSRSISVTFSVESETSCCSRGSRLDLLDLFAVDAELFLGLDQLLIVPLPVLMI